MQRYSTNTKSVTFAFILLAGAFSACNGVGQQAHKTDSTLVNKQVAAPGDQIPGSAGASGTDSTRGDSAARPAGK